MIDERFELERLSGVGGMAHVYRCRDLHTRLPVALKILHAYDPSTVGRFQREAQLLSSIQHPGIVGYVAHGTTPSGFPYLAMEWLEGETLSARLSRSSLSLPEILALLGQICDALAPLHRAGIVHRDLKPSNVFLTGDAAQRVKLLDFGIALLPGDQERFTASGALIGSVAYMPPEQARGERNLDPRADVFALGCIAFRALTGKTPFEGDSPLTVALKVLLEDPPLPSELNPELTPALDELILSALEKDPDARPRDAIELGAALKALDAGDDSAPATSRRGRAEWLSQTERRVLCLVMARTLAAPDEVTRSSIRPEPAAAAAEVVRRYRAALHTIRDGTTVVVLSGAGAPGDHAVQGARCALDLRALLGAVPMALTVCYGVVGSGAPVGRSIDASIALLKQHASAAIRVDELTAGLLEPRFVLARDQAGTILIAERDAPEPARLLLGRPTPCVGREREIASLEVDLEEAIAEPSARAVVVTGPAGIGKSRLAHEFLQRARAHHRTLGVWRANADPMRAGSPLGLLAAALEDGLGISGSRQTRQVALRERVERSGAADVDRISQFLAEILGAPFAAESVELRAARREPMLMGDQMRRAWEDLLEAECARQPVLIVLEDLQWGDLPTVSFVDSALRNLENRPFMVLALARPELHSQFPRLWHERSLREVRLRPLGNKAAERLVREMLGLALEPERVTEIVERASGNAFFLEELIRRAAAGGRELPETVLGTVEARLSRLEPEARRVLRAASVFGERFWTGGVAALLGSELLGSAEIGSWLGLLENEELVTRARTTRFGGEAEYAFRHALVRDAAYAMLTERDRMLGHALAGAWLERAKETDALLLAEHFERGARPERAIGCYLEAARQALRSNDLKEAIQRAERGVAAGARGSVRASLLSVQAEARRWLGQTPEAERAGEEALASAERGSATWCAAAAELAIAASRQKHHDRVVELARELMASAARGTEIESVALAARISAQLTYGGKFDEARALLAWIDESAVASEPLTLARVLQARSTQATFAGDTARALELMEAAVSCFQSAGDLRNACLQRGNVAFGLLELGFFAHAESVLSSALASARRLAVPHVVAFSEHNLGIALARLGRLAEAARAQRSAVEAFVRHQDHRLEVHARVALADVEQRLGNLAAAEAEARRALEMAGEVAPTRCAALATLAAVLSVTNRASEAFELAREADALLESQGSLMEGEALVRLIHARSARAVGEATLAQNAIRRARQRLVERAAKIRDPSARQSFLSAVPEHAETLELGRELLDEPE